jgi:glycerol-3-phosphate acyltransferase PlsY
MEGKEGNCLLWQFLLLIIGGYLIGSIPCGYLLGRLKGVDLLQTGSGNIGATNAFRVLGRPLGFVVFFCDIAKGFIPALIGNGFGPMWGVAGLAGVATGLAAVVGHNWSVYLAFRGGRGAATGAGVVLALMPRVIALSLILWALIIILTGYVSLASVIATLSVPAFALIFRLTWNVQWVYFIYVVPAATMIILRHLPNMRRLWNGTEPRMRFW